MINLSTYIRRRHILEIFIAEQSRGGDAAIDQSIYHPPFTHQGETYGPARPSTWENQVREYRASIYGGGLWDPAEDTALYQPQRPRRHATGKKVGLAMLDAFVKKHSDKIPERELSSFVAVRYWGLTHKQAAHLIDMTEADVRHALFRLRKRAKRK